jgi:hypothetical protein
MGQVLRHSFEDGQGLPNSAENSGVRKLQVPAERAQSRLCFRLLFTMESPIIVPCSSYQLTRAGRQNKVTPPALSHQERDLQGPFGWLISRAGISSGISRSNSRKTMASHVTPIGLRGALEQAG